MIQTFPDILAAAKGATVKRCLILPPITDRLLERIREAVDAGLPIVPLFLDSQEVLGPLLKKTSIQNRPYEILGAATPDQVLMAAIAMMQDHRAQILMRGGMAVDAFVSGILDRKSGLLSGRQASYVSIFQLWERRTLILATDTYIHNAPSLADKVAILENALALARLLELPSPVKVAALAAIEQINPGIPSTLEAAILSKMAERGQLGPVLVEGPLDIDCAVNRKAALRKGVRSVVTGRADLYLVPEIETGYQFAQILATIGQLPAAGCLMGTKQPVVLDLPFIRQEYGVVEMALAVLAAERGGDDA